MERRRKKKKKKRRPSSDQTEVAPLLMGRRPTLSGDYPCDTPVVLVNYPTKHPVLKSYPVNCKHFIDVNIVLRDVINHVWIDKGGRVDRRKGGCERAGVAGGGRWDAYRHHRKLLSSHPRTIERTLG